MNNGKTPFLLVCADSKLNLAEGRPAYQSSTEVHEGVAHNASLATDGSTSLTKQTCSQTRKCSCALRGRCKVLAQFSDPISAEVVTMKTLPFRIRCMKGGHVTFACAFLVRNRDHVQLDIQKNEMPLLKRKE